MKLFLSPAISRPAQHALQGAVWLAQGVVLVGLMLCVFGCSKTKDPLPGQRQDILQDAALPPVKPGPHPFQATKGQALAAWPLPFLSTENRVRPVRMTAESVLASKDHAYAPFQGLLFKEAWSYTNAKSGSASLLMPPVVQGGMAFFVGGDACVHAVSADSGKKIWVRDFSDILKKDGPTLGGGVVFYKNRLYATLPQGLLVCLDPKSGKVLWFQKTGGLLRAAPTVHASGLVFVLSMRGQLEAFDVKTGQSMWMHTSMPGQFSLRGAALPSVSHDVVVVAYGSGEVYALAPQTGRVLWTQTLWTKDPFDILDPAYITASPVIRGKVVTVVTPTKMVSMDLKTGDQRWQVAAGGTETPFIIKDNIFCVSGGQDLVRLSYKDGGVLWRVNLNAVKLGDQKPDLQTRWLGPLMINGNLYVLSSTGLVLAIEPEKGRVLGQSLEKAGACTMPLTPLEAGAFVLSQNGALHFYKALQQTNK